MTQVKSINKDEYGTEIESYHTYKGEGGLQQVFAGLGLKVFENLSIGANLSYLYGDISHAAITSFNNTNAFNSVRTNKISISSYKLDFGALMISVCPIRIWAQIDEFGGVVDLIYDITIEQGAAGQIDYHLLIQPIK